MGKDKNNSFGWLLSQSGEQKGKFTLSVVLAALSMICGIVPYYFVAEIVKMLLDGNTDTGAYIVNCVIILALWLGHSLFHALSTANSHLATFHTLAVIRKKALDKLAKMPLGNVINQPSGSLKSTIVERIDSIETTLAHILPEFTTGIGAPVIVLIYVFVISWKLGLAALITVPIGLVCYALMMFGYEEKYGRTVEAYRQKLTESISLSDEPYGKAAGLFRIHSWAPVYASYSGATSGDFESFYSEGLPGATVYSQNTLGTMRASAGYAFQHRSGYLGTSKNLHSGHATLAWSGWYPVFEGSAHFNDRIMYKSGRFSLRTALSAYVPLSWSRGGWLSGVTPVVSWSFRNDQIVLESVTEKGKSTADDDSDEEPTYAYTLSQVRRHQVNFAVGAYRSVPVAKAQVYPRWGIGGRLKASVSPSGGSNFGSEASAYIYAYLPGLTFNQGLRLSASYQRQMASGKKYWLDNHLELPRGFTEDFYGRNMVRLTADYAIPAYLGDVSLGPIAYLQQLQVIPFVDYGKTDFLRKLGTGTSASTHFVWEDRYSFGADVMVKGHFLRIGFPMYLGVRYARTNKPCNLGNAAPEAYAGSGNRNFVSLLFGVTIY